MHGRQLGSMGQALGEAFTILESGDNQQLPSLAGNGEGVYLLAWEDDGNGSWDIYGQLFQGGLDQTAITYDYDPLYRLTGAAYTGAISAAFLYQYDPVGNMTAFTETVTSTLVVTRTFDPANQLESSTTGGDATAYSYDDNGNLTEIMPPGATGQNPVGTLRYGYDQRNMLITNTLYISGAGWALQAAFAYDGAGDRLQQVDYSGAQAITTTYANDILGLTQVLVADDGASEVTNLFGLDLIHQDDGGQTLTLLADGLGSVRVEMVGSIVEATTTYEPYGNLLSQNGSSQSVYGFTGEQEDDATGLLYLRARYYSESRNQQRFRG